MSTHWFHESAIAVALVTGLAVGAAGQEKPKVSDQLMEQLATQLTRLAEAGSARMAAYFTAEPTPQVRAYLEGQGVEVVVTTAPVAATPAASAGTAPQVAPMPPPPPAFTTTLAPASASGPYGVMGMRVPESKKMIQDYLVGVRDLAASLPPDSPLAIEGFTVDLPGGSVMFRLR
jgi:hypothetical protein